MKMVSYTVKRSSATLEEQDPNQCPFMASFKTQQLCFVAVVHPIPTHKLLPICKQAEPPSSTTQSTPPHPIPSHQPSVYLSGVPGGGSNSSSGCLFERKSIVMMNDQVSLGVATEVIVMTIVIAMLLLFVGIVVLIIIYVYTARRALSGRIGGSGGDGSSGMVEVRGSVGTSKSSSMSRDDVEKLPSFHYIRTSPVAVDDDCAVCLDNFNVGDKCRLLPICSHKFHAHCVDLWLLSTPICPICRTTTATITAPDFSNSGGFVSSGEESESQRLDDIVIELS